MSFLSLVQTAMGVSFVVGPSPTPFLTNVPLTPRGIPVIYQLVGVEPVGTYLTYAALIAAGTDPFQSENQISVATEIFDVTE